MKGNPSSTPRTRGMSRDPAGIENAGPSAPALNRAVISSLAEGTNPAPPSLSNRSTNGRPRVSRLCHARKTEKSIIFTARNTKRTTAIRLKPLPQQQRRDLAFFAQLHRCDRTFIPHNNQAFQHPLVHGPWIDRIEVNPCPALKTGDRRNPPLDQNPHAHRN